MFKNLEGQLVPNVVFKTRENNEWIDISTDDLFAGKTVVVFSLPGAFTPTCSSSHVPRYNQLARVFFKNGVDSIVCISVNDTFVMNEWKKDQSADNIIFVPDGNADFTSAMGLLVNKEDLGFGKRSWRYSMLVKDGKIIKMFIEPELPGDPYEVSDADTMLNYINPDAEKIPDITVFTKPGCTYSSRAKSMLDKNGLEYEEIQSDNSVTENSLRAVTGQEHYPQVYINGKRIGGTDELQHWLTKKKAA